MADRAEPRLSLGEAAKRFFPDGSITKNALKHQIRHGRLRAELICGRYFVTEFDLLALCRAGERNGQAPLAGIADTITPDLAGIAQQPLGGQHG